MSMSPSKRLRANVLIALSWLSTGLTLVLPLPAGTGLSGSHSGDGRVPALEPQQRLGFRLVVDRERVTDQQDVVADLDRSHGPAPQPDRRVQQVRQSVHIGLPAGAGTEPVCIGAGEEV